MRALWQAVQECGWPAYALLFASAVALGAAAVAVVMAAARARLAAVGAGVALALALLAVAIGPMGTFIQRRSVEVALASGAIEPATKARILALGYAEAAQCTNLGLGFGALPLVLAAAALAFALTRRESETLGTDVGGGEHPETPD